MAAFCDEPNMSAEALPECSPYVWLHSEVDDKRPPRVMVLPGAWAIGDGLVLEMADLNLHDSNRSHTSGVGAPRTPRSVATESATATPGSSLLRSSLSRIADDLSSITSSVGSYFSDIATALGCSAGCSATTQDEDAAATTPAAVIAAEPSMRMEDADVLAGSDVCSCYLRIQSRGAKSSTTTGLTQLECDSPCAVTSKKED